MTPPVTACSLSALIPIPWASIRAWLDAAEQAQAHAATGTTTLTQQQLLALSQLVSFCAEPRVPKEDHVSKLMRMSSAALADHATAVATPMEGVRYANGEAAACWTTEFSQGNRLDAATFEMSDPVDVPYKGVLQLRWHCECVLPWCGQRFPKKVEGAQPALFANKKDAKQYAALQAVAYLTGLTKELATTHTSRERPPPQKQQTAQLPPQHLPPPQPAPQPQQRPEKQPQHLPASQPAMQPPQQPLLLPTSNRPTTPPPAAPSTPPLLGSSARPKRPLDSPNTHGSHRESPLKQRQHAQSTPSPSPSPPSTHVPFISPQGNGADAAAEQQRLFDSIRRLSSRLGVSQPQYRLTQSRPNFFSGHAEFPPASRVPAEVAVVRDVLGKRQARIQIAAKVLAWMEKEEAKRTAQTDELLQ